ncbi:MAG: HU family DNA-binding protein [Oligoflexia bacterium]|nr:HU family DNA-binding protein [Oligoflexia bacterium]
MNRKQLLDSILSSYPEFSGWNYRQADLFLHSMIDNIQKCLKRGEEVTLVGFGTFQKVELATRKGRNPSTGQEIDICAKSVPRFRPGQAFKDYI